MTVINIPPPAKPQLKVAEETNPQLYQQFINSLSQSVFQKDLLKAIVEEARSYLNCDRVVVYSLNQDKYGKIIAESVALGYGLNITKFSKPNNFLNKIV